MFSGPFGPFTSNSDSDKEPVPGPFSIGFKSKFEEPEYKYIGDQLKPLKESTAFDATAWLEKIRFNKEPRIPEETLGKVLEKMDDVEEVKAVSVSRKKKLSTQKEEDQAPRRSKRIAAKMSLKSSSQIPEESCASAALAEPDIIKSAMSKILDLPLRTRLTPEEFDILRYPEGDNGFGPPDNPTVTTYDEVDLLLNLSLKNRTGERTRVGFTNPYNIQINIGPDDVRNPFCVNVGILINMHGEYIPGEERQPLDIKELPHSIKRRYCFFMSSVGTVAIASAVNIDPILLEILEFGRSNSNFNRIQYMNSIKLNKDRINMDELSSGLDIIYENVKLRTLDITPPEEDRTGDLFFKFVLSKQIKNSTIDGRDMKSGQFKTRPMYESRKKELEEKFARPIGHSPYIDNMITVGNMYANKVHTCDNNKINTLHLLNRIVKVIGEKTIAIPPFTEPLESKDNNLLWDPYFIRFSWFRINQTELAGADINSIFDDDVEFNAFAGESFSKFKKHLESFNGKPPQLKITTTERIYEFLALFNVDRLFVVDQSCNSTDSRYSRSVIGETGDITFARGRAKRRKTNKKKKTKKRRKTKKQKRR